MAILQFFQVHGEPVMFYLGYHDCPVLCISLLATPHNSCKHFHCNPTLQGDLTLFHLVVLQNQGKSAKCHHEQTADCPFLWAAASGNNYASKEWQLSGKIKT